MVANPIAGSVQFAGLVAPRRTTPLLRVVLKDGDIVELVFEVVTKTLLVVSFTSLHGNDVSPPPRGFMMLLIK